MENYYIENKQYFEKIDFLKWVLERNINFISTADSKTGYLITINMAMLAGLAAAYTLSDKTQYTIVFLIFSIPTLILSTLSIYCAAISVWPRTSGPNDSLIFFASISNLNPTEYLQKINGARLDDLINDLSRQIHRNAEIAKEKYKWVRKSVIYCFTSSIPWFATIFTLIEIR